MDSKWQQMVNSKREPDWRYIFRCCAEEASLEANIRYGWDNLGWISEEEGEESEEGGEEEEVAEDAEDSDPPEDWDAEILAAAAASGDGSANSPVQQLLFRAVWASLRAILTPRRS